MIQQYADIVAEVVCDRNVRLRIAVEVSYCHREGARANREVGGDAEASHAIAQQNTDGALTGQCDREAQQTKRGNVYIISNVGSFGEHVYKIGMTRRQEPQDRVDELGDASVPFRFDVHAMIPSEDAPKLESTLHKTFEHRRVNLVNLRKEFFAVTLEEIREIVVRNHGEIQFTLAAEAEEYRKTQAMRTARAT